MISPTGKNLNVLISAEHRRHHDWMVYAGWYSIHKNLPDAIVKVICRRHTEHNEHLFNWISKVDLPFRQYAKEIITAPGQTAINLELYQETDTVLVLTPDVMAVQQYNPYKVGPIGARQHEEATFASYLSGVGSFWLEDWRDKGQFPFGTTDKFFNSNLSINEYRILKMWSKCYLGYYSMQDSPVVSVAEQ